MQLVTILSYHYLDIEYWIESDTELDLDLTSNTISPLENIDEPGEDQSQYIFIVRWIMFLLAFFQTRFFISDTALGWILQLLSILLKALGKFSDKIVSIAALLPASLYEYHKYTTSVSSGLDSLYRCEEYLLKTGSLVSVILLNLVLSNPLILLVHVAKC